jgi:TP901 family phage tail tape measure protein
MSSAGSLWVEILPKFLGGATAISDQVVPAATKAGVEAGDAIAKGVTTGATEGASQAAKAIQEEVVAGAKSAATESNAVLSSGMVSGIGKKIASELKAAEQAVADSALRMQAANAATEASANKVALAETKLAEARAKYAADSSQVVAAEGRLADAEANQALAAAKAEAATKANADAQVRYTTASKAAADVPKETTSAIDKLSASMANNISWMDKSQAKTTLLTGAIVGGLAVGMGVKAVSAAADFQTSQERLVTTAGELRSNLEQVSNGVLQLAGQVGISAADISTGMYTVESAGFHGADGLTVMKAAAQGAKEENADLATVTDAVTSSMQDYHLGADQAALVTSRLITAVSDGKTTFQDLTGAMSSVLPVASSVGVSMQEVLGDLSSMTLHGMSADQASQNLANAIRSLANPTLAATKELAALGINAADLSKNLGKTGVQGTMEQISEAILKKMGPAGTTLLNAFNQSKQAAADANTMFANLPPKLQGVAKEFEDGKISMNEWRQGLKSLPADQAALLTQWVNMQNNAHGFSDALKTGGNAAQTYTQALAKATGNSTSMNVALMLTGENAEKTKQNIADVGKATTEAGNNTKGWSDIQSTFNQKMSEAKASMGALGISIGQALLPLATKLADVFGAIVGWMAKHETLTKVVVLAFGGIAVAIGIATVAMIAFNSAVWANPVTWIVAAIIVAIGLLVVGIYELVTHWKQVWAAISGAAQAVYNAVIKPVFDAIVTAAKAVGNAFAAAWHGIVVAAQAVGNAFVWLWNTILKPVFDAISFAVRLLIAIILTVLVTPLVWLFNNVIAPVFKWLYSAVVKPIFDAIASAFNWLYNNVIRPVVALIKLELQAFEDAMHWLYDHVIKPILDAIGTAWNWFYDHVIKPVIGFIKLEIQGFEDAMHWLYDHVIKPVLDAISTAWNWLYDHVIKPIVNGIKIELQAWGDAFSWLHDHIIKPIGDAIGNAFHSIGQGISNVVDWIKSTWSKVQDIVKAPAKFIVQTVYDDAIVPTWNGIAGVFGLGKIDKVDTSKWAGGGILPGYQPGVDSIPAMLSPGEAVLVPEAARMLGYGNILALNAQASGRKSGNETNGLPIHAAGGGVFGAIGDALGSVASKIWDGLKTAAGWVSKGVGAVTGEVTGLFSHVTDLVKGTPNQGGGNQFTQFLTSVPGKVVTGAIAKIKDWFGLNASSYTGGGTGAIPAGQHLAILQAALTADGIPQSEWPKWLAGLNTLITRESSWNASAVNNWDSNAKAGHPSMGLGQTIASTFARWHNPSLPGGILDPVANVAAVIRYIIGDYGDITHVQQANASAPPKGYSGGGIALFDEGGWAEPGVTALVNASGRPEPVFSSGQWDVLKKNINTGGGDHHYHITSHDPTSVAHELERRQRAEMAAKLV